MFGSPFDGNAAFSGGGFMPSQATQSADPSFSPAKNRDTQAMLPLTVKQINEAFLSNDDKSNFLVDGVDVNNVTLVGIVLNKAERVTDVAFVLDDGTGRMDCNKWVNEAADTKEMEGVLDGMYVRIYGNLRGFQGKRTLNVFSIRPVNDFNEIPTHFLECMCVHLYNTKKMRMQSSIPLQPHQPNAAGSTPMRGYEANPSYQFSVRHNKPLLQGTDQMVFDYLALPQCVAIEKGVHCEELVQRLKIPMEKVRESIHALIEDGYAYETIDDNHVKLTLNG